MKVIATIQSTHTDDLGYRTNDPVEVSWYNGVNLAQAISALVMAAASYETDSKYTEVLDVRITF